MKDTIAAARAAWGLGLLLTGLAPAAFGTAAAPAPPAAVPTLRYTLAMPAPQTHYFEVQLDLAGFGQDYTDVKMPVWAPGSYLVREFARHVEGMRAQTTGGRALAVEKLDKNTWRVRHPRQAAFQVSYRVYAFELSVRTSFVDADHGYANGSSVFVYPALHKALGSTLAVQPAPGWARVSTALRPVPGRPLTYRAASYDELADSPIEIGNHKLLTFVANGSPHEVAMHGTYVADEVRLLADLRQVCEAAHRVVGRNPLDRPYLFIVHNNERGGGGLEHSYSTTLEVGRAAYGSEAGYKGFLGLVAHEYFHLWNVKRIRPVALGPFDYDRENYTRMLWVSEGQTEYVSNQLMLRAGFQTPNEYLAALAAQLTAVENAPGNRVQPVAEASFDAWIRFYRPNENSPNSQISYYDKGEVVGAVLDVLLLEATGGQKRLDDVFRLLYDRYYLGLKRGFTDAEYQDAVAAVAGRRFDDFFQNCVYGTQTPDYATAFGHAGLRLVVVPGGASDLGATVAARVGKLLITSVRRDGPAWRGGLSVNDELLQLDGQPATEEAVRQLSAKPTGTAVRLQVRRDGLPRELTLTLATTPDRTFRLVPNPDATPAQVALGARWLQVGR